MSIIEVVVVATIIAEAESQGVTGMQMVAEVIRNRTALRQRSLGDPVSTVLWPWQFSCWNTTDPSRYRALSRLFRWEARGSLLDDPVVIDAGRAWNESARNNLTGGATHYFSTLDPNIRQSKFVDADGVPCPDWAAGLKPSAVHKSHRFYAGVK